MKLFETHWDNVQPLPWHWGPYWRDLMCNALTQVSVAKIHLQSELGNHVAMLDPKRKPEPRRWSEHWCEACNKKTWHQLGRCEWSDDHGR